MKNPIKFLFALIILIFLNGCTARDIRNSYKLTPQSGKGLLVIRLLKTGGSPSGIQEYWYLPIERKGKKQFVMKAIYTKSLYFNSKDSDSYEEFNVIELEAGNYTFGVVCRPHDDSCNRTSNHGDFTIESGKALYYGDIEMIIDDNNHGGWRWVYRYTKGFDDQAVDHLKSKYPNIDMSKLINHKTQQSYLEYIAKGKEKELYRSGCVIGNCLNGFSTFVDIEGNRYEGEYRNGKFNGHGTWTGINGFTYKGQWKNGNTWSNGSISLPNGTKIVISEWFGTELNYAVCVISFVDGSVYYGIIKEPEGQTLKAYAKHPAPENLIQKEGQGVLYLRDGSKKEGIWKQNHFLESLKISDIRIRLLLQKYPPPARSDNKTEQPKIVI